MGHDATKLVMGGNRKSFKVVDNIKGDHEAGLLVRRTTAGLGSQAKSDGEAMGISFGKDLGGAGHSSICRAGLEVPILLTASFTPVKGTQVHISDTTGKAIASGAGATGVNAVYASGPLTAVKEDGTEVANGAALIDYVGGL